MAGIEGNRDKELNMFIQTEKTPNPETMKFYPGNDVSPLFPVEINSKEVAPVSPLAERLFLAGEVNGVFLGADFISITKSPAAVWEELVPDILSAILEHYISGDPVVNETAMNRQERDASSGGTGEIGDRVKDLLETHIKPVVSRDGGDIQFHGFEDGIVYLKLRGACAGCPGAAVTLKMGVERLLRDRIPEVREVRAVNI